MKKLIFVFAIVASFSSLKAENAERFLKSGNVKLITNNLTAALEDYNEAIVLNPEYLEAYLGRAFINDQLKNYSAAIEDYSQVILLDSVNAFAYFNRGLDKHYLANMSGACYDWEKAFELNRNEAMFFIKEHCGQVADLSFPSQK